MILDKKLMRHVPHGVVASPLGKNTINDNYYFLNFWETILGLDAQLFKVAFGCPLMLSCNNRVNSNSSSNSFNSNNSNSSNNSSNSNSSNYNSSTLLFLSASFGQNDSALCDGPFVDDVTTILKR